MQFLVFGYDGTDAGAPERRMAAREAHLRLGDEMIARGELLYAIAILDDLSRSMTGSVCVVDFPSRHELEDWLKIEPYVTGGVWKHTEIRPCRVGPSFQRTSREEK